ncbi:trypsin-like cysteine/serine peptidase domain-containing protein [Cercophora newfieldiana]|uniref:Trypsin-like cysteine/serine peptidase domain-containing protein n=1 Tax=Cercophora newfieldiana TaxID=92897 RepID=A0AA40CSV6_9PEZI|nr:trypsin-like cysteine/serine peptidase domain-containing protein [Cercophora newfieldiana]
MVHIVGSDFTDHSGGPGRARSFRPKGVLIAPKPDPGAPLFTDVRINQFQFPFVEPSTRHEVPKHQQMMEPYRMIGKVLFYDGERPGSCTGVMVGSDILLTAGHCINNKTQTWSLEFIPAYSAEDAEPWPLGKAHATQCKGVRPKGAPPEIDYGDIAVCQLNRHIGHEACYLRCLGHLDNQPYLNGTWYSVGYPNSYKQGNVPILESGLKVDSCEDMDGTNGYAKWLRTQPYVDEGWSGGPLLGLDGDGWFVLGVVASVVGVNGPGHYGNLFPTSSLHTGGPGVEALIQQLQINWGK